MSRRTSRWMAALGLGMVVLLATTIAGAPQNAAGQGLGCAFSASGSCAPSTQNNPCNISFSSTCQAPPPCSGSACFAGTAAPSGAVSGNCIANAGSGCIATTGCPNDFALGIAHGVGSGVNVATSGSPGCQTISRSVGIADQGGIVGTLACNGGTSFASATGATSAAGSVGCGGTAATSAPGATGGAAAFAVCPATCTGVSGVSSSLTIATNGGSATANGTGCSANGASIAIANSTGGTSCINIAGTSIVPPGAYASLADALAAAGIPQSTYNSLVPLCLQPTADAIFLTAIGASSSIPAPTISFSPDGGLCATVAPAQTFRVLCMPMSFLFCYLAPNP